MDAKLILDLIRIAEGVSAAIANWTATASPEAIKALVAEAHARGETVDLAAVDRVIESMKQSGTDLDEKIRAAGG